MDTFNKLRQGQDSIMLYYCKFKEAARKIAKHRTRKDIIEHFIEGFADQNIVTTLMIKFQHRKIKNLNDAYKIALLLARINEGVNYNTFRRAGAMPSTFPVMPSTTAMVANIRHKRQACQHCSRVGHDSKDCWIAFPELRPANRQVSRNAYDRGNSNKRRCGAEQQESQHCERCEDRNNRDHTDTYARQQAPQHSSEERG
jgi:hypothetical protein